MGMFLNLRESAGTFWKVPKFFKEGMGPKGGNVLEPSGKCGNVLESSGIFQNVLEKTGFLVGSVPLQGGDGAKGWECS